LSYPKNLEASHKRESKLMGAGRHAEKIEPSKMIERCPELPLFRTGASRLIEFLLSRGFICLCTQGLLPAAFTRDNGMIDVSDFGEDGPPLTIGKESILFYETLLKMWILTGKEAEPPSPLSSAVERWVSALKCSKSSSQCFF
jgi:hypothetical protein